MLMITPGIDATQLHVRKPCDCTREKHGRLFIVASAGRGFDVRCETWAKGRLKADEFIAAFSDENDADDTARFLAEHMIAAH